MCRQTETAPGGLEASCLRVLCNSIWTTQFDTVQGFATYRPSGLWLFRPMLCQLAQRHSCRRSHLAVSCPLCKSSVSRLPRLTFHFELTLAVHLQKFLFFSSHPLYPPLTSSPPCPLALLPSFILFLSTHICLYRLCIGRHHTHSLRYIHCRSCHPPFKFIPLYIHAFNEVTRSFLSILEFDLRSLGHPRRGVVENHRVTRPGFQHTHQVSSPF